MMPVITKILAPSWSFALMCEFHVSETKAKEPYFHERFLA